MIRAFRVVLAAALALCAIVVVLGAFVRLSDAGLGCPDWPGCYGRLVVPEHHADVQAANAAYPDRPVHAAKAWKEMVHRYGASTLGALILLLAALALADRQRRLPRRLPVALVVLVILQGLLGMWTVTLLLKPAVVTAHLLGGMTTLALLWWLWLATRGAGGAATAPDDERPARQRRDRDVYFSMIRENEPAAAAAPRGAGAMLRLLAAVALGTVVLQVFLGGWTSSNYAALACTTFPKCHGAWWPDADFREAFVLWRGLGINYEYGVLDAPARTAIHLAHRAGALVVTVLAGLLGALLLRHSGRFRAAGGMLLGALALQVALGISTVLLALPLPLATAHNAGAALLLLAVVYVNHLAWKRT